MEAYKYSLTISQGIPQGAAFVDNITHVAKDWTRSTRWNGGYWMGTFVVNDKLSVLQDWFYNRLGYHVVERAGGGVSWEGLIYEMELSTGYGITRRRSLDDMYNAVRAFYASSDGSVSTTAFSTEDNSITRYGRRDNTETGTYVSAANAATLVTRSLSEAAWPWARCTGVAPTTDKNQPQLKVTVCGYVWTANWLYMPDTWSSSTQVENNVQVAVSDWFTTVFGDTSIVPFLTLGSIEANSLQVQQYIGDYIRVWDWAQEINRRGFGTDITPARLWVGPGRHINYASLDTTPRYFLQNGKVLPFQNAGDEVNPWTVKPGVVRDVQYPRARSEPGSILSDARDILVDEVSCNANGELSLYATTSSLAEAWSTYSLAWREDMMRWYSLMDQLLAQAKLEEQNAWDEDLRKREEEWRRTHPWDFPNG